MLNNPHTLALSLLSSAPSLLSLLPCCSLIALPCSPLLPRCSPVLPRCSFLLHQCSPLLPPSSSLFRLASLYSLATPPLLPLAPSKAALLPFLTRNCNSKSSVRGSYNVYVEFLSLCCTQCHNIIIMDFHSTRISVSVAFTSYMLFLFSIFSQ